MEYEDIFAVSFKSVVINQSQQIQKGTAAY